MNKISQKAQKTLPENQRAHICIFAWQRRSQPNQGLLKTSNANTLTAGHWMRYEKAKESGDRETSDPNKLKQPIQSHSPIEVGLKFLAKPEPIILRVKEMLTEPIKSRFLAHDNENINAILFQLSVQIHHNKRGLGLRDPFVQHRVLQLRWLIYGERKLKCDTTALRFCKEYYANNFHGIRVDPRSKMDGGQIYYYGSIHYDESKKSFRRIQS
ncbi:hypothetical protein BDA99DRAFT_544374 [Phascolomyces articulosus]|uniref:Uncharacterized protein n=1 Tax=Phascolomyces articulosus TaxID=60185 RepID=A0AAD5JW12_9FUNG|nr:hypothetical protein BDA99DRAFT_544374 [Phascolomyces articulosus]